MLDAIPSIMALAFVRSRFALLLREVAPELD
jgi:hypothetical protein